MARRRQLEAPSAEALKALEEGFARETRRETPGVSMPIASVAGEAAALTQLGTPESREAAERDKRDAERLREAEKNGQLAIDLPLADIAADELVRDRMALDPEEMEELKTSIAAHGMRMPIEVFKLAEPRGGAHYALLSGYRRLAAIRELHGLTGDQKFATIRALVREPGTVPAAFVAMVEENEIRSGLSQYERGRVAVLAVEQGAFGTVEEAVDALFHAGSKAKRSKLRSFALIHEELGDLLVFPQALSERQGLRLASALRAGKGGELRNALASGQGTEPEREWALLEAVAEAAEAKPKDPRRGGRPRTATATGTTTIELPNGISLHHTADSKGHSLRFSGKGVDDEMIEKILDGIRKMFPS